MPPKVFKRPPREGDSRPKSEQMNDKAALTEKWDINIRHVIENTHVLERTTTLTSILAGTLAGLFNTNLYSGIFTYLFMHLVVTVLIFGRIGDLSKFFMKKADIISGAASGVPVFMCVWIIVFNVVYTL